MRSMPMRSVTIAILALGLSLGAVPPAAATCGDGVFEPLDELCDAGAANGTNACCTTSCTLVDSDHDGVCDADDPCVSPVPPITAATLIMRGFTTPAADDSFRLTATIAPSTQVDPAASGFFLALSNQFFGSFVQATIPGGAAWRRGGRGGWIYHDKGGSIGGITRVGITPTSHGGLEIRVRGQRRDYTFSSDIRPLQLTFAFTTPPGSAESCAEAFLSPSRCTFDASGSRLRCLPPPALRRCGSSDPDARVRCDVVNAAAAQEAYYVTHGTFLSGNCSVLPDFVPSPGVLCTMAGGGYVYSIVTAGFDATITCVYDSLPRTGQPNLVCS